MSYIVIPKALFVNPDYQSLSVEAKMLYGFLDDRSSLSRKNGAAWKNKDGEYFVYFTQEEVREKLGCGHDKATKILRELEKTGLIERTRQGQGRPQMLVVRSAVQMADDKHRGVRNTSVSACDIFADNKTDINNLDISNPDTYFDKCAAEEVIKDNICYDILTKEMNVDLLDVIISVIAEAICSSCKKIKIAGVQREQVEVRERFLNLNDMHIRYIYDRLKHENQTVYSPKGYLLKHLFEAQESMDIYYQTRVASDEFKRRGFYG